MQNTTTVFNKETERFDQALADIEESAGFAKNKYVSKILSSADALSGSPEGIEYLYSRMEQLHEINFFEGTVWEDANALVPTLVGGTLKSGGKNTVYELLSELRMLAIFRDDIKSSRISSDEAQGFLREVIVNNLDLVFPGGREEFQKLDKNTRKQISSLFDFILNYIPLEDIKKELLDEVELISAQRPIIMDRVAEIVALVHQKLALDSGDTVDEKLQVYVKAKYHPTTLAETCGSAEKYGKALKSLGADQLKDECTEMSRSMAKTGLVSEYHVPLVQHVAENRTLLGKVLGLNKSGVAELAAHHEFAVELINKTVRHATRRCIYGFGRLLERSLLSHQPVLSGLKRIMSLDIHPEVSKNILKTSLANEIDDTNTLLEADVISMLGQPLGIGQGWNPTCQSARGISLWSQHAPGKLLRMIITAAKENNLSFRFEEKVINSRELIKGVATEIDFNLDVVSIVLVPHLDKIYNRMMQLSNLRPEDAHKWVNPAMYGQWIPTGFISAYNAQTKTISNYEKFVRTFYITHHPKYNGGHDLAYPNPVGIFITSAQGKLLGFHAISILRVADHEGETRVYFLNPNNEGRQSWQHNIQPTVAGNGERRGESSLLFHKFASRLYAFHYNESDLREPEAVDANEVECVEKLAKESWGEAYTWIA
jgi:hypothetical protein